jgi:hypothetical protein
MTCNVNLKIKNYSHGSAYTRPKGRVKRSMKLAIKRNKIVNAAASSDHPPGRREESERGMETVLKLSPKGREKRRHHESGFKFLCEEKKETGR